MCMKNKMICLFALIFCVASAYTIGGAVVSISQEREILRMQADSAHQKYMEYEKIRYYLGSKCHEQASEYLTRRMIVELGLLVEYDEHLGSDYIGQLSLMYPDVNKHRSHEYKEEMMRSWNVPDC